MGRNSQLGCEKKYENCRRFSIVCETIRSFTFLFSQIDETFPQATFVPSRSHQFEKLFWIQSRNRNLSIWVKWHSHKSWSMTWRNKKLMGKMRLITRGKDERRWLSLITKKALRQMPKSVPISIAHRIFDCHLMKHLSRYLFHFKRIPPMIINYLFNWVIFV